MARHSKFSTSVRFWQLAHIATLMFVFSFIAFDLLDLDLSAFPLKQEQRERVVVVTETNLLERHVFRIEVLLLDPSIFKESLRFQRKAMLRTFSYRADRIQVHRITHPLSSTLESSPAA